ncbi:hypothetical protein BAJUN_01780 [Bajunvirus bajun]|uniref:Uncharacterized protein n=1 Tax=Brevundimonas phage vB_BgoS-Bajun TaxID=2948594 RepID=A0A9E7SRM7_9CAUD|nr:hypothetical protein BAJUN_01780 [Brevundimonas phage vB_BgoS-Bajun]
MAPVRTDGLVPLEVCASALELAKRDVEARLARDPNAHDADVLRSQRDTYARALSVAYS